MHVIVENSVKLLLLFVVMFTTVGCQSGNNDATKDGYAVKMLITRPGNSRTLLDVQPDGTLRYAGGRQAIDEAYCWTGSLLASELSSYNALMASLNWFAEAPFVNRNDVEVSYDVTAIGPDGRVDFEIAGESNRVAPVRKLLEKAARRRLDQDDTVEQIKSSLDSR